MNNDIDLRRLVGLLSYLKKHDDVESDIGKARAERRPEPGMRVTTPWERAQSGETFTSEPGGSPTKKGSTGYSTAAGGSASAYQTSDSSDPGIGPSSLPSSSSQTLGSFPEFDTPPGEKEIYVPEEDKEFEGPRGGSKGYQSSTPKGQERQVVTPMNYNALPDDTDESKYRRMQEDDTSDDTSDVSDEEREIAQWIMDEGWTLAELKQMIEEFTSPLREASKKITGPQDYQRHSGFQKSRTKIVRKFNESNILNLFNRLGI